MIGRAGWLLLLALLAGCGLDSYEILNAPDPPPYGGQSDYLQLKLVHDPARFQQSNFHGYEVYYRLYPDGQRAITNLARDASQLTANPTKDYLQSLGYQRLNGRDDQTSPEPLVSIDSQIATSQTIVLDFTGLQGVISEPLVSIDSFQESFVYRTLVSNATPTTFSAFSALRSVPLVVGPDMAPSVTAASLGTLEADFFLVSVSVAPETLRTAYSTPVPWGIITPIPVSP